MQSWLNSDNKPPGVFGITSTHNGEGKHWLYGFGWHSNKGCYYGNRYFVCIKHTPAEGWANSHGFFSAKVRAALNSSISVDEHHTNSVDDPLDERSTGSSRATVYLFE